MTVFTHAEQDYLRSGSLARLATVGPDGQPHVVPITFHFNETEDAIDIGGIAFDETKKWRDAKHNPRITFLVDETSASGAKAIEVRGMAEVHETGGESIHPRFPNFRPQFLRIRPRRVISWGVDPADAGRFRPYARDV